MLSCARLLVFALALPLALALYIIGTGGAAQTPPVTPAPQEASNNGNHRRDAGPWKVANRAFTLHDATRGKDLEVRVRFPDLAMESGTTGDLPKFPLVVFSHGMGGSRDAFAQLSAHLAGHGYVVVHPTHDDSVRLQRDKGGDVREFMNDPESYRTRVDPVGRVDDVKFLIGAADAIEEQTGMVGAIDVDRGGGAGHSAGAMTTQLTLGVSARGPRLGGSGRRGLGLSSIGDDRVDVGIVISGQGTTTRMFTEKSWETVDVPMLVIAGSKDTSRASNETPESRCHPFDYSRGVAAGGPPAYLLYIEGAHHASYAGKEADSPEELRMIVECTHAATRAMLDAYLKTDAEAVSYLADGKGIEALSDGRAELRSK